MNYPNAYNPMNNNSVAEEKLSLLDVLSVLFRHKWKIIACFLFMVTASVAAALLLPKTYESYAKILIRLGRENMALDPGVVGPALQLVQDRENQVNSELSILRSRSIAEKVVDKLGEDAFVASSSEFSLMDFGGGEGETKDVPAIIGSPRPEGRDSLTQRLTGGKMTLRDEAIQLVMQQLRAEVEPKSEIINLTFQARSPELAQKTLTFLLDFYREEHIEIHKSQASPQFFQVQMDQILQQLKAKEKELEDFRAQYGIASIQEQEAELIRQIGMLQSQVDDAASTIQATQARIQSLRNDLQKNYREVTELNRVTGKTNYAADAMKEQLTTLKIREAELAARYPDDNRQLVDVREQIAVVESMLARESDTLTEVTTGLDTHYRDLQLQLVTEQSQIKAQQERLAYYTAELEKRKQQLTELSNREIMLASLNRDLQLLEEEYSQYRDSLLRAKISEAQDLDKISNVSIVQPPTYPIKPTFPRKRMIVMLGMFLGLFGGIALAYLREFMDDSLKKNADVERQLGLPVITAISDREFKSCL